MRTLPTTSLNASADRLSKAAQHVKMLTLGVIGGPPTPNRERAPQTRSPSHPRQTKGHVGDHPGVDLVGVTCSS